MSHPSCHHTWLQHACSQSFHMQHMWVTASSSLTGLPITGSTLMISVATTRSPWPCTTGGPAMPAAGSAAPVVGPALGDARLFCDHCRSFKATVWQLTTGMRRRQQLSGSKAKSSVSSNQKVSVSTWNAQSSPAMLKSGHLSAMSKRMPRSQDQAKSSTR